MEVVVLFGDDEEEDEFYGGVVNGIKVDACF